MRGKPAVRIIRVVEPRVVKTDAANFRSVVQSLTGCNDASLSSRPSDRGCRDGTCHDRGRPSALQIADSVQRGLRSITATQARVDPGRPGVLSTDGSRRVVAPAAAGTAAPDLTRRRIDGKTTHVLPCHSHPPLFGGQPHADVSSVVMYGSPASSADGRRSGPPLMATVDDDSCTPNDRAVAQDDDHQYSCTISQSSPCIEGPPPVSFDNDDDRDDDCDSHHPLPYHHPPPPLPHHHCRDSHHRRRRRNRPLLQPEQQEQKPVIRSDPLISPNICTTDQHGSSPFYQAFETIFHDQLGDTSFDLPSLHSFQDLTPTLPLLDI